MLFDADGNETWHHRLTQREDDTHFLFIEGLEEGERYGLRAHGPYDPAAGHHFDHRKLLLDPYARAISGHYKYSADLSRHGAETAHLVPKAVATPNLLPVPLRAPRQPSLIYELNVRGFTKCHPGVPEAKRGTIAALAESVIIDHFKRIGADTIELMPIAVWIDERHLANLGLRNAWGYNPVSFFAIDPRLAPGGLMELRETVSRLHQEGINVILDVVLNHTGEGDALGPTLSFRGLDNKSYYRLFHGSYVNDAGTGNTLALDRPHTVALAIESLRHWVLNCGIDGFRFDLATIMGRTSDGFDPEAPLLRAISEDSVLSTRLLIVEPWDIGPDGYQLGRFPAGWFEWNDKYRDDVRRFFRGDRYAANALATRITGSADVFGPKRKPSRSINFVAAHDGFTLADLLRFDSKHNEANGEGNRDGKDHEVTCIGSNARALLATLFLSRGTPMLTAGDEFGRSQNGNNNAYAQDNEITWLDWEQADKTLTALVATLADLRRHLAPWFDDAFLTEAETSWRGRDGLPIDWKNPDIRTLSLVMERRGARLAMTVTTEGADGISIPARPGLVWRQRFSTNNDSTSHPHAVFVHEEVAGQSG